MLVKKLSREKKIENRLKSELQENILKDICKNSQSGYLSLTRNLNRDRITILQSVKWLIKNGFIVEEYTDPNHRKSKRIFTPTEKGLCYSIAYLDANIDDTIKHVGGESELYKYKEFTNSVKDYEAREQFMRNSAKLVLDLGNFDKRGKSIVKDDKKLFQLGLASSLTYLTSDKNFDVEKFFKNQSMENLKKVLTKSELNEIKQYFSDLVKNLGLMKNSLIKELD